MKRDPRVVEGVEFLDNILESVSERNKGASREVLLGLAWAETPSGVKDWVRKQILRCRKDPRWLFGNYFWIQHPRSGEPTTLDLFDTQELILETIEYLWGKGRPGWILIHKARQLGCSTFAIAMLVWRVCFHSQVISLILAQDEGQATYELSIFQWFMNNMPWWLKPNVARQHIESRMVMGIQGDSGYGGLNSFIIGASIKKMSAFAQGKPFSDVHITEVGSFPDKVARKIIDEDLSQMVSRVGCVGIMESKPYGASGWWYNTWHHYAKQGKDALWHAMFLPCFMEKSRTTVVPASFKPLKEEVKIRERYFLEWKRCSKCSATYYAGGSSGSEAAQCHRCGATGGAGIILSDGQLGWYRMQKSKVRDDETEQSFLQEFAMTAEEGFQIHGKMVFPKDVYRYVQSTVCDPVWVGEWRRDFTFHCKGTETGQGRLCCNPDCQRQNISHNEDEMSLKVWEQPQPAAKYFIGADAAYGEEEGDYGVITVHKCGRGFDEPDVQVAEWRCRGDAGTLGEMIFILATVYNHCEVAIEVKNGPGEKAQLKLIMMGYDNIYRWKHYDQEKMVTRTMGWVTNGRTKPMLITTFIEWCRQKIIVIKSKDFLFEMPSFIKRADYDESGSAANGKHDDCVPEGTLIQTSEGAKPIEEIKAGELVLTHKGRWRPVVSIGNRYEPDRLFEVSALGRPPIYLTAEHPALLWKRTVKHCERGEKFQEDIPGKKWHKRVGPGKMMCHTSWTDPDWVSFGVLENWKEYATGSVAAHEEEDRIEVNIAETMPDNYKVINGKMVGFRRRWPCVLPRQNNMDAKIPLSTELLMMMGYYLAEGSRGWHTVQFASHDREIPITEYMAGYLKSLGLNPAVSRKTEHGMLLSLTSVPLNAFFKQFSKSDDKRLPAWCDHLPPDKQKWILAGYLLGDGCFRKSNGSIDAQTISYRAAFQLFNISLRCGWACGMGLRKRQNRDVPQYHLSWDPAVSDEIKKVIPPALLDCKRPFPRKEYASKNHAPMRMMPSGEMVGRIRTVKKIPFCGTVYNLTVEEDHSFVANGTIISNSILANTICLLAHHDQDYDVERGRIVIPHERLRLPDPSDPGSGLYVMTCIRGHVTTAQNPHGWVCPTCKESDSNARVPALSATRERGRGISLDPLAQQTTRVDPEAFMSQSELVEIN